MASYAKIPLSGSINGKKILVTATTSGSANPIHTAISSSVAIDEVWLYAYNDDITFRTVSILWGGTNEPTDVLRALVPAKAGRMLVVDGMVLQNGLTVKAYADSGSVVTLDGFVNNIIQ